MADDTWALAEAKARLSEVVERALHQGPQRISRNGKKAVVVVAEEAFAQMTRRGGGLAALYSNPGFLTEEEHDEIFVKSRDRTTASRLIDL